MSQKSSRKISLPDSIWSVIVSTVTRARRSAATGARERGLCEFRVLLLHYRAISRFAQKPTDELKAELEHHGRNQHRERSHAWVGLSLAVAKVDCACSCCQFCDTRGSNPLDVRRDDDSQT